MDTSDKPHYTILKMKDDEFFIVNTDNGNRYRLVLVDGIGHMYSHADNPEEDTGPGTKLYDTFCEITSFCYGVAEADSDFTNFGVNTSVTGRLN